MPTDSETQESLRQRAERRNLGRLHIAASDLYQAYELAEILYERAVQEEAEENTAATDVASEAEEDFRRRRAVAIGLETAMIIAYCRPFLNSSGGRAGQVAYRLGARYLRAYDEHERKLHDRLIDRRNSEVAHSDGDAYSLMLTVSQIAGHSLATPIMRNPFPLVHLDAVIALRSMIPKLLSAIANEQRRLHAQIEPGTTIHW